jgi:hypothetical protein
VTQLALPLPTARVCAQFAPTLHVEEPTPLARLGAWMVGDGPRPVELDAVTVARLHRQRVRASWGAR